MKTRIVVSLIAVCLVGLAATAALAQGGTHHASSLAAQQHKKLLKHFAVLSHGGAKEAAAGIPAGAVTATTVGDTTVFVDTRIGRSGNAELCVGDQSSEEQSEACNTYAGAEHEGVDLLTVGATSAPTATVLVPNGVTSVAFVGSDGVTDNVAVTNNVAILQEAGLASLHYSVPDGATRSETIRQGT